MPLGPTHASPGAAREPIFVGRRQEMRLFENALLTPQAPREYRVISLYGVGGQGKTAILEAYRRRASAPDVSDRPLAILDFEDVEQRSPLNALLSSTTALRKQGVATHAFDVAFARYFALTRPGRDIRSDHPELFKFESGLLGELAEILGGVFAEVPGGKLLYQGLSRFSSDIAAWYGSRGQPILEHLDELDPPRIRADLPVFLGADLHRHAVEQPGQRPFLLIDGYERLWADHPGASTSDAADEWLRRLVEESPGCLFVVAGRRPVQWQRIDNEWSEVIQPHELPPLDGRDVERLLDHAEIAEAAIRNRIMETAKGHPLSLKLQLNAYQKIKARGRAPQVEDFPATRKDVIDRFLGHLDPTLRTALQIVAVPRQLDRSLWSHLQRSGFASLETYGFEEVGGEVVFQGVDPDRRTMLPLVRSHLLADVESRNPELLKRVRLVAFDFFNRARSLDPAARESLDIPDRSKSLLARDACLSEAAELLAAADPERFTPWCIALLRTDLADRGSKHRVTLLNRATKLGGKDLRQRISLAKLCAEIDPFSDQAENLLAEVIGDGLELDGELQEELEAAVLCLTHGERTLRSSELNARLRSCVRENTTAGIRLALSDGDAESAVHQARHIFDKRREGGRPVAWDWDLLTGAAYAGDRQLAEEFFSVLLRPDQETLGQAVQLMQGCLLVQRPEWALNSLCRLYGVSDISAAIDAVVEVEHPWRRYLVGMTAQSMSALGEEETAQTLVSRHLGAEGHAALDEIESHRRVRVEFVVNDQGETMVLCDSPLLGWRTVDFVLMPEDVGRLWFSDAKAGLIDFGICFAPKLQKLVGQGGRLLLTAMDPNSKTPATGDYRRVFVASTERMSGIRSDLIEAGTKAREMFRKAAVERPG